MSAVTTPEVGGDNENVLQGSTKVRQSQNAEEDESQLSCSKYGITAWLLVKKKPLGYLWQRTAAAKANMTGLGQAVNLLRDPLVRVNACIALR